MTEKHLITAATYALLWEHEKAEKERLCAVLRDMLDILAEGGELLDLEKSRRVQLARAFLEGQG